MKFAKAVNLLTCIVIYLLYQFMPICKEKGTTFQASHSDAKGDGVGQLSCFVSSPKQTVERNQVTPESRHFISSPVKTNFLNKERDFEIENFYYLKENT